jgi:hypothetical protein
MDEQNSEITPTITLTGSHINILASTNALFNKAELRPVVEYLLHFIRIDIVLACELFDNGIQPDDFVDVHLPIILHHLAWRRRNAARGSRTTSSPAAKRVESEGSLRPKRTERLAVGCSALFCRVLVFLARDNRTPEQTRWNRKRPRQSTPATSDEAATTSEPTERQKRYALRNETTAAGNPTETTPKERRNNSDQQTQSRQSTAASGNKAATTGQPDRSAARYATKPQRPENQTPAKGNADARDRTPSSPAAGSL